MTLILFQLVAKVTFLICSNFFNLLQLTTPLVHCIVGYSICCRVLCCVQHIFLNVHSMCEDELVMHVCVDGCVFLKAVPAGFHCERHGAMQRLTIVFLSFTSAAPSFNRKSSRQKRNCESHTNRHSAW